MLDMVARRPSGRLGRVVYGRLSGDEPLARLVLDGLGLGPDDAYLEIGQGGGRLLARALETAGRAAGIDHSADMAALARRANREAVADGRAHIVVGDAAALPWPDDTFTCAACVATFLFFEEPMRVLREVRRVLRPGGRLGILTPAEQARGVVSRLFSPWSDDVRLYTPDEMIAMLGEAGFVAIDVEVRSKRLLAFARTPDAQAGCR